MTPACAGKSVRWAMNARLPRESPPRARGRGDVGHVGGFLSGITPACAGKRRIAMSNKQSNRNHPRVRGEETFTSLPLIGLVESPPRARGRAGGLGIRGNRVRNHPRVRGEEY